MTQEALFVLGPLDGQRKTLHSYVRVHRSENPTGGTTDPIRYVDYFPSVIRGVWAPGGTSTDEVLRALTEAYAGARNPTRPLNTGGMTMCFMYRHQDDVYVKTFHASKFLVAEPDTLAWTAGKIATETAERGAQGPRPRES
jgi:hypothetical protein